MLESMAFIPPDYPKGVLDPNPSIHTFIWHSSSGSARVLIRAVEIQFQPKPFDEVPTSLIG
jgi:hypothetical protein